MNQQSLSKVGDYSGGSAANTIARTPSIVEQRMERIGSLLNELDATISDTIGKLSPIIVQYPSEIPPNASKQQVPREMQSEHAAKLEQIGDGIENAIARLRVAMSNSQI